MTMTTITEPNASPYHTLNKLVLSFTGAIVVTFGLFAFMHQLISQERPLMAQPVPEIDVFISQDIKETPVEERKTLPPQPKPLPKAPPKLVAQPTNIPGVNLDIGLDHKFTSAPITMNNTLQPTDAQATPLVRIDPNYPVTAARDGIEGWVQLTFSISPTGQVIDAQVVNAEPKRIFNRAALKALKRWKYRPQMVNGKAIVQTGQSVMLEFNLAKEP
ncbi:TonB family protein [Pseudoalteromonas sp. SMS1]|uniref:energy transducer TonB n=1 Tax=Pseudoalteromonas sp. SMS1 TaxID=2908894 RepID=UPI001F188DC5|nr:energy transducer TonB [Pseudoalteromonas sp. SMS1]MCF2860438.1 TonB family protein [Pseudoalteromonas sp. SMS1]